MRRRFVLMVLALVLVAATGFAQFRADVGLDIPWRLGAVLQSIDGDSNESIDVLSEFTFLIPDIRLAYEFGLGPVSLGLGARLFTLILESMIYPAAFAEVDLGPVAVNLNVGGGAFLFFGLWNHFQTAQIIVPDLSAHFKIGRSFRIGAGVATLVGLEIEQDVYPYVIYASGKFVIRP